MKRAQVDPQHQTFHTLQMEWVEGRWRRRGDVHASSLGGAVPINSYSDGPSAPASDDVRPSAPLHPVHTRRVPNEEASSVVNNGASDVELGRAAINGALGRFLESERVRESFAPLGAGLLEDFAAFVLGEGKRFRPLLVLASWRGLGPGPVSDPQVPLGVGVALELFHTFLLIHDDIIDDADMRRGAATLRRRLADRHAADANARRLGDHLAIILGDICFTLALEHLNALPMPDPIARTVLTELLRYARLTGVGQVMDVAAAAQPLGGVTGEQILLCYDLKTAQYTIECPLVLGAMLAGATDVEMDALRRYARALGVAYQIRDDLIGVSREVGEKSGTLDFEQGRQTLLLALTLEGAHPQGRRWLEERFGAGALSAPDAERLLELYRTTGAVEVIEGRIARLRQEALEALGALDEGSGAQRLRALVHQLVPV